jgi:hypothetical protein
MAIDNSANAKQCEEEAPARRPNLDSPIAGSSRNEFESEAHGSAPPLRRQYPPNQGFISACPR